MSLRKEIILFPFLTINTFFGLLRTWLKYDMINEKKKEMVKK